MLNSRELYEKLVALSVEVDSHESDMYVPATEETSSLIEQYEFYNDVKIFESKDGSKWFDLPFVYLPFWQSKGYW